MAKPNLIELPGGEQMPILYEDRSVLAIDKPPGWMLAPAHWQHTSRNLQLALTAGIRAGAFWARSRNLRFLRFVHRLDADTSGVLLLVKSPGGLSRYGELFESRSMEKTYLAVVRGKPGRPDWTCRLKLAPDPAQKGRMKVDPKHGKEAETRFRVLECKSGTGLVLVRPLTGRTHQIRVHLAAAGHPVLGDELYGAGVGAQGLGALEEKRVPKVGHSRMIEESLALRAVALKYTDPFTRREVRITARIDTFLRDYGFDAANASTVFEE